MSFLKYLDVPGGDRGNLSWGRAGIDGAPFRGPAGLMLKEEQWENLSERVYDARVETFDLSKPDQLEAYQAVMDRASNKWYKILACDRQFLKEDRTWLVLVEYLIPHMEIPAEKINSIR